MPQYFNCHNTLFLPTFLYSPSKKYSYSTKKSIFATTVLATPPNNAYHGEICYLDLRVRHSSMENLVNTEL